MRKIWTLLLFIPLFAKAQPAGYYNNAQHLNGQNLRAALHDIIKNHTVIGYSGLWSAYQQTDKKPNGKVWDMYSDKPGQTPPYEYKFGSDQCGNYNSEGDCYNREHSFPKSYFNDASPMYSDLFIVYPTDGYVNGKRSNYPFGEVSSPAWTSMNGSRLGPNTYPGAPAGTAFEPVDSFKGDFARTYFYFVTRYYTEDNGWKNWEMANKAELKPWAVTMLLEWHQNDPVSKKEIDRNNAVYSLQNNRNPFIDYPAFADCIWGAGNCTGTAVPGINNQPSVMVYPNPAVSQIRIDWEELAPDEVLSMEVLNLQGQIIWHKNRLSQKQETIPVSEWAKGVYLLKIRFKNRVSTEKIIIQ